MILQAMQQELRELCEQRSAIFRAESEIERRIDQIDVIAAEDAQSDAKEALDDARAAFELGEASADDVAAARAAFDEATERLRAKEAAASTLRDRQAAKKREGIQVLARIDRLATRLGPILASRHAERVQRAALTFAAELEQLYRLGSFAAGIHGGLLTGAYIHGLWSRRETFGQTAVTEEMQPRASLRPMTPEELASFAIPAEWLQPRPEDPPESNLAAAPEQPPPPEAA